MYRYSKLDWDKVTGKKMQFSCCLSIHQQHEQNNTIITFSSSQEKNNFPVFRYS